MYITCKKSTANLQLIDKLIVPPDTLTVYSVLYWLTWLQNQEASVVKQQLIVCLLSVTEWLLLNVAKGILIRAYKFRTANKAHPPLRIFLCQNSWNHFAERWVSRESSFGNIILRDTNWRFKKTTAWICKHFCSATPACIYRSHKFTTKCNVILIFTISWIPNLE